MFADEVANNYGPKSRRTQTYRDKSLEFGGRVQKGVKVSLVET
jgi:hypothetical protein